MVVAFHWNDSPGIRLQHTHTHQIQCLCALALGVQLHTSQKYQLSVSFSHLSCLIEPWHPPGLSNTQVTSIETLSYWNLVCDTD